MDSPNDSGDDLFITQSTFRVDTVDTQVANEAANFFLDSDDDILCTSFENLKPPSVPDTALPEVVEYVDFSNDTDKGYTLLSTQEYQEKKQSEIFEPILPNLFHFYHDKVCRCFYFLFCTSYIFLFFLMLYFAFSYICHLFCRKLMMFWLKLLMIWKSSTLLQVILVRDLSTNNLRTRRLRGTVFFHSKFFSFNYVLCGLKLLRTMSALYFCEKKYYLYKPFFFTSTFVFQLLASYEEEM